MYQVDDRDRVTEIEGLPQSSVGAPIPIVLADEHRVMLAYYLQDTPADWDGTWARVVDQNTPDEPIAVVVFDRCTAHMFGLPKDEAFSGHPLAARGLKPYSAFEAPRARPGLVSRWVPPRHLHVSRFNLRMHLPRVPPPF